MTKKFYIVIYYNTEYKEGKALSSFKIPKRIFCCRFSKRLQAQERLTIQIAHVINKILQLRGVKKPGTVTSVVRGLFRDNPTTRAELEKDI